ncbi:hypothetical protein KPATCC21470_4681 [Kitasatospora purpeofusca]
MTARRLRPAAAGPAAATGRGRRTARVPDGGNGPGAGPGPNGGQGERRCGRRCELRRGPGARGGARCERAAE